MRLVAWGLGSSAAALVIGWLATAPAPPPQRFGIAADQPPPSAYVVRAALHRPCEEPEPQPPCCEPVPRIEIHVERAALSVFVTEAGYLPLVAPRGSWQTERVARRLRALRRDEAFVYLDDVRIVAHAGAAYRDVIHAMELADQAGFGRSTYVTPSGAIFDPGPSFAAF